MISIVQQPAEDRAALFQYTANELNINEALNRFSEDIDLILDWRTLGYDLKEPLENRSNTKNF